MSAVFHDLQLGAGCAPPRGIARVLREAAHHARAREQIQVVSRAIPRKIRVDSR